MISQYNLISADSHLDLPPDRWTHRVPLAWRDRAPRRVKLASGGDAIAMENRPLYLVGFTQINSAPRDQWRHQSASFDGGLGTGDPEQRVREQNEDGVDAEVLFTHSGYVNLWRGIGDDEGLALLIHSYNEFLIEDYAPAAPDRLLVMGVIPPTNIEDALRELEFCARSGFKGVALYKFPNGNGYPTPEDDRFWSAALDIAMPIVSHTVGGSTRFPGNDPSILYPKRTKTERGDPVIQLLRFASETPFAPIQMAMTGVFDRFPQLRIYWAETQVGWLAPALVQLDENYDRYKTYFGDLFGLDELGRQPSKYVVENNLWGFLGDTYGVKARHEIGIDAIMWGSDFAHAASDWPNSKKLIDKMFSGVPDAERAQMTCENAVEFFALTSLR